MDTQAENNSFASIMKQGEDMKPYHRCIGVDRACIMQGDMRFANIAPEWVARMVSEGRISANGVVLNDAGEYTDLKYAHAVLLYENGDLGVISMYERAKYFTEVDADGSISAYPNNNVALLIGFGGALRAMMDGAKVARRGWNGKGMWIAMTPGSTFNKAHAKDGHAAKHRADEMGYGEDEITLLPHIDMRAADGSMVVGWLASQSDMMATDWVILE